MATVTSKPRGSKITNYFAKEKRMLKLFGISFRSDESFAYKIYSFVLIFSMNFMYPLLQSREVFKQDMDVISDMLIYLFGGYVGLSKTIVVLRNRIQIGKILDKLEKVPFTVNMERGGAQEEKLIKECLWITNIQTLIYWAVPFLAVHANTAYAFIKRVRSNSSENLDLPFGPLTIVNVTYSPNYEIALAYQGIYITCLVAHFSTIDVLMAAILAHISYQFKILQNNIRRVLINCCKDMPKDFALNDEAFVYDDNISKISWKILHKHLKKAIEYHLEIIDLAKNMELVFSQLLLLICVGTLGILCFSVYRLSVVQDNMEIFIHGWESASACMQVLTVCYWGEILMFESQKVGKSAFEANFVGTDLRFQKSLVIIIRRSQNPIKLTAGKFSDICLATFTWFIRATYSAFMVVSSKS